MRPGDILKDALFDAARMQLARPPMPRGRTTRWNSILAVVPFLSSSLLISHIPIPIFQFLGTLQGAWMHHTYIWLVLNRGPYRKRFAFELALPMARWACFLTPCVCLCCIQARWPHLRPTHACLISESSWPLHMDHSRGGSSTKVSRYQSFETPKIPNFPSS